MPIEVDIFYIEEKILLIRELYAEDDYNSGIKEALSLMNELFKEPARSKYYTSLCKLLALGYRKSNKAKQALQILDRAINYTSKQLNNTQKEFWEKEIAILHVNKGIIYENSKNYSGAINEYLYAERLFSKLNDKNHLFLLYQTLVGTYISTERYDEAADILISMNELAQETGLDPDGQIRTTINQIIKEKAHESC